MNEFRIEILTSAAKQLDTVFRSDRKLAAQFAKHIESLVQTPYPQDVVILAHAETYDLCRTKIGRKWRLIYAVIGEHAVILVVEATSREGAYKGRDLETLRNRIQTFLDMLSE